MKEKDFSILGIGLLGFFFCICDEKKMEEAKAFMGKWIDEHGGVNKVWEDYYKSFPPDTPKETFINTLEDCVNEAIKKGYITKFNDVFFKRDYKIVIQADNNNKVFWSATRKGENATLTDKEFKLISEMVNEIGENLKKYE